MHLDVALDADQLARMAAIPGHVWFTQFTFRNAESPVHPNPRLVENNTMKMSLVADWVRRTVPGKRVLDLFAANGAMSCLAALAGASAVVGVEFDEQRVECARFVASTMHGASPVEFVHGDVYDLDRIFDEPFDVVLCFGGLYHVADPAYVLTRIRELTEERLLLQTAQVIDSERNIGRFSVRKRDGSGKGMTSVRRGSGTWRLSPPALRELLAHAGFQVLSENYPPEGRRRRFPWYLAEAVPL